MNRYIQYTLLFLFLFIHFSCVDNIEKDDIIPEIDMTGESDFPQNCATVYRGESFTFAATFTDNMELGSFSIEMHNNFDHHTHSTDITDCETDPNKLPVNPLLFINQYEIPTGQKSYVASIQIDIPDDIDTGDYHFMVRLTDAAGWQALRGISVKVADHNSGN